MRIGSQTQIRRYPVKSMEGEVLDAVELSAGGLPGDRAWAVRDEVRGGIRGAKKIPALMRLSSRYADKPAPEGRILVVVVDDAGLDVMTPSMETLALVATDDERH